MGSKELFVFLLNRTISLWVAAVPFPCGCNDFFKICMFWFQPRIFFAFSLEAIKTAGSPALLSSSTALIGFPVTFLAVSMTSFTVNPTPFPRLKMLLSLPSIKYFTARICACASLLHEYSLLHKFHLLYHNQFQRY